MTIEEMKARKKELGLSNREIAEQSGVPLGTVQKIFGGKTTAPRHETIMSLNRVFIPDYQKPINNSSNIIPHPDEDGRSNGETRDSGKKQGAYTIEDWDNLPEDVQAELIEGKLYFLSTPMVVHQELVISLSSEFKAFVQSNQGKCRIVPAPVGVRLFLDDHTMVEPDISVICNRDHISPKRINGAPDLVVEILSPSNRKYDMVKKLELYERAGVKEYWIVDPEKRRVMVYLFNDADVVHIYTFDDKIPVGIWDGRCVIDFAKISEEISYLYDGNGNLK